MVKEAGDGSLATGFSNMGAIGDLDKTSFSEVLGVKS